MTRGVLVISDAGPLNSLWLAGRLDLLLLLEMQVVVPDAVYDEATCHPTHVKDAEIKAFIDGHRPPFIVESTFVGTLERQDRSPDRPARRNIGELATMDFFSGDEGARRFLSTGDAMWVLFEDRDLTVLSQPENMHLLSTSDMLRGMERAGLIPLADAVIREMTHPTGKGRRPEAAHGQRTCRMG